MAKKSKLSSYSCGSCDKSFKRYTQLERHRLEQREVGNGHIHCEICGIDFAHSASLVSHYQECHPVQEDLKCPGCGATCKYVGDLINHVVTRQCPKISRADWDEFAKQQAEKRLEKDPFSFSKLIENTQAGSTVDWQARAPRFAMVHVMNSGQIDDFAEEDFPALSSKVEEHCHGRSALKIGGTKQRVESAKDTKQTAKSTKVIKETVKSTEDIKQDVPVQKKSKAMGRPKKLAKSNVAAASTHESKTESLATAAERLALTDIGDANRPEADTQAAVAAPHVAWGQKNNLFPEAAAAKRPTAEQLRIATAPNARAEYLYGIHDPGHAHFDAEKYKSANGRYVCPMDSCVWTYDTAAEITLHLRTLGEHGGRKAECPGCRRLFKTAASLAHHAQMSGDRRCRLRQSSRYAEFVEEVSGGLATVGGHNEDMTTRHEATEAASTRFGPVQNANRWDKNLDSDDDYL